MEQLKAVFNVEQRIGQSLFYLDNRGLEEPDPRRGIYVTKAACWVDAEHAFKHYGVWSSRSHMSSDDPRRGGAK